jgi:putative membrane protein
MEEEFYSREELILRDHLALDRTRLANERTLLAYLRTALMLMVAGATVVKFVAENTSVIVTGWVFIAFGALVGAFGIWRFNAMRKAIDRISRKQKSLGSER